MRAPDRGASTGSLELVAASRLTPDGESASGDQHDPAACKDEGEEAGALVSAGVDQAGPRVTASGAVVAILIIRITLTSEISWRGCQDEDNEADDQDRQARPETLHVHGPSPRAPIRISCRERNEATCASQVRRGRALATRAAE